MDTVTIVQIVSVAISLIAAVFFYKILEKGIRSSKLNTNLKLKYLWILLASISIWVALMFLLTINNIFSYQSGDIFPKFLIGLFIPVLLTLILFGSKNFREILNHITFEYLVAGQIWRVLGAIFFVVAISGLGPTAFISSGFGDLFTGLIAIFALWALTKKSKWSKTMLWSLLALGVTDLLVVLFILLSYYPIWSAATPSTAIAGSFPMMLIVGIAAPFALLMHVFMFRKLIVRNKADRFFKTIATKSN